ncbi:Kelch repeat-containing protein [Tropicibacter oceani]|uniref:Kelch repeat-containing protein n=1 Tax=Tropicibacter oceani TaxID=3058420 RepID=A0ABY8QE54_9RHOB|nr:kelch repeat-containing protein [Tropicibacter oceani]WGW02288.1 kelch repeat-containing protein [Tropicibacter oceani]
MNTLFWKYLPLKPALYPWANKFFGPRFLSWTTQAALPVAQRMAQGVVVNDKIYVFGGDEFKEYAEGHVFTKPAETVFVYDTQAKSWDTAGPVKTPRSHCAAFRHGENRICVMGGFEKVPGQWARSNKIEFFDCATHTWTSGGNFPANRNHYAAVLVDDRYIYAIGGRLDASSDFDLTNQVIRHDLETNEVCWPGTIAPLPTPRASLTAVVGKDGLIYALGGLNDAGDLDTVEAFDPAANEWHSKAPMLMPRRDFSAVVGPSGHIYVLGGMTQGASVPYGERYDPALDSWTPVPDLPEARMYHTAAITQENRIFVIGGQLKEDCSADPVLMDSVWATTQAVTD